MEITQISPVYVYTQSTTPNDVTEGKIWVDTTTSPPVTKISDGTTYNTLSTDLSNIRKSIGLNGLNILDLTAQSTLTAGINANFERDVYSDSTGYLNTIDAGNTTASFFTDKFANGGADETLESGFNLNISDSESNYGGYGISVNITCNLSVVTKSPQCTGTTAYLRATPMGADIATATFVGNVATFDPVQVLTKGQTYAIMAGSGGAGYTRDIATGISYPVDGTYINLTGGVWSSTNTPESNVAKNIDSISISLTPADKIVQTNAQTTDAGFTNFMIIAHETTAGTGSVNYDIAFDGTNYQTSLSSFTEYTITDVGTSLILKQNLNGTGAGNIAQATDWGVLLW